VVHDQGLQPSEAPQAEAQPASVEPCETHDKIIDMYLIYPS
jgi:hypothetical protein